MSRYTASALSVLAVLTVIGLSTVVGFVGHNDGFGWELAAVFGTALGTTLLAAATGVLALMTWRDVSAAQELARLTREGADQTRESLELTRGQAETARAALDAQTQPFLTVGDTRPAVLNASSAHVRNVGNATAVVMTAAFIFRSGAQMPAAAVDPAMPVGDTTAIVLAGPRPSDEPDDDFSVAVAYADVSGRTRGAVRLGVRKREQPLPGPPPYDQRPSDRWWVRQVFWGDTFEHVTTQSKFGSQPVDDIDHERAQDPVVVEWQRVAADETDKALRELRHRVLDEENPGALHNAWQDQVLPPSQRLADAEILRRVKVVGWVLYLAIHAKTHWTYAAADAIEDAQAALSAFLRREPKPVARFPDVDTLRALVGGARQGAFDDLNAHLASR